MVAGCTGRLRRIQCPGQLLPLDPPPRPSLLPWSEAASSSAEAALPDGTYAADFDTDSSMFHAVEAFGRKRHADREGRSG